MKKSIVLFLTIFGLFSCKSDAQIKSKTKDFNSFGKVITSDDAVSKTQILEKYKTMKVGDTMNVKFNSTIQDVCQAKGCWMKLDISDKQQSFVKFKDYAFFMPKDSKGNDVVVNGKAFVTSVSVAEQKHYAEDDGQSKEEIEKITEPKLTYSFLADGVLIKVKK